MALARFVYPARHHTLSPRFLAHHQRHRSGKAHTAQLVELDLDSSSTSSSSSSTSSDDTIRRGGMRKLEEVIQNMIVLRSAPDWLPFVPGSSYWVPPANPNHPISSVVEVLGRLSTPTSRLQSDSQRHDKGGSASDSDFAPLCEDERMFKSNRAWPSSAYFIQVPVPVVAMEVDVKILDNPEDVATDGDEEG